MKVILAGYNLDREVIEALKRGETQREDVTPETLSAAYARISRDPRPVDELRTIARVEVEKARKSNQNIIFKMGHHSVAEHAVFNFDIIGVSRLALEELEKFRLCSYTEKSQRYQTLEDDPLIPEEIQIGGQSSLFKDTVAEQNAFYHKLVQKNIEPEDARYVTSLATLGQVGMTINARNLELLFRRFASHPLAEVQALGREMFKQAKAIAPSIILFTEANPLDRDTYPELKKAAKDLKGPKKAKEGQAAELVDYTREADLKLLAALVHTSSDLNYSECLKAAKSLTEKQKKEIIKTALKNLEFYDATLREFEHLDLTYELTVSAACFGQLKRHRLATLTCQNYDPALGVTLPPSIKQAGLEEDFLALMKKTEAAYRKISSPYILTNAHRKRVLFKCNARELYHISRLREDTHAQWDIQELTKSMTARARSVMPLTLLTIGGKDAYPDIYEQLFGVRPKAVPLY